MQILYFSFRNSANKNCRLRLAGFLCVRLQFFSSFKISGADEEFLCSARVRENFVVNENDAIGSWQWS
jgi:hypothetical protein